jgi:hypothetical protein
MKGPHWLVVAIVAVAFYWIGAKWPALAQKIGA